MKFTSFHVLILYLIGEMISFTFLVPYLVSLGVSDTQLLLFFLVAYVTPVFLIGTGRSIDPKKSMMLGFGLRIITSLSVFFLVNRFNSPLIGLIGGPIFFLFWIPLNYSFLLSVSEKHASESWKYSFAPIIVGIIFPSIGGVISYYLGLRYLFITVIPVYLLNIFLVSRINNLKPVKYTLKDSLKKYSGLRTLTFIEGFWQPTFFIGIPLITSFYIRNSLKFGGFYSYLGIASALSALVLARYSDKSKKRKMFIYISSFVLAAVSLAIAFHTSFAQWKYLAGIAYFIYPMSNTFFLAMFLDFKKQDIIPECVIAREYLWNFGRACGTIVLIIFSVYGSLLHGMAILGVSMLAYPLLVKVKKIYAVESINVQN